MKLPAVAGNWANNVEMCTAENALTCCVVPTHVIAIPVWGRLFCNRSCCFPASAVQNSRWRLCASGAEPSCWTVLLLLPPLTKMHVGMRQVSPTVGLGCDYGCCFPSLIFPGPLICLSLEGDKQIILILFYQKRNSRRGGSRPVYWSSERFGVLWIRALVAATL